MESVGTLILNSLTTYKITIKKIIREMIDIKYLKEISIEIVS